MVAEKDIIKLECAKCNKLLVTIKGKCKRVENDNIYCEECADLLTEARIKEEIEKLKVIEVLNVNVSPTNKCRLKLIDKEELLKVIGEKQCQD